MKQIVLKQYQEIVDQSAKKVAGLIVPAEGWIRTMRNALGMSGAQLGRRLKVSRAQIAQAERNELSGAVTLKTLQKMAEAMNCRVVYAFVPETSAQATVKNRAREKAEQLVSITNTHMALENQSLDKASRIYEVERLTSELLNKMPSDLWDDV